MHVGLASGFANHLKVEDARFVKEELSQLLLAEELGFDSVWMTEHHFSDYSISPDPLTYLAWIAGQTRRLRLGTQVIVVPWHDPVRLAEQIVLLDHLSGGRAIIGFGRGLARMEYEGLRVEQSEARQRFDDGVAMIMDAMETGYIEGDGFFKQPRRELRPRPLRSLKGRAFCAAGSPSSMSSAAKLGLGRLYLGQPMVLTESQAKAPFCSQNPNDPAADAWLETWREVRPDETPVAPFVSNMVFVDESSDRAHERADTYMSKTLAAAIKNYELTSEHHGSIKGYEAYAQMRMTPEAAETAIANAGQGAIAGTPKEVLEQLDEVRRMRDPQGMMPHLHTGGMPHEETVAAMRLFAEKCLPEVKSWPSATPTIDAPFLQAAE